MMQKTLDIKFCILKDSKQVFRQEVILAHFAMILLVLVD
jgi:hypothetical protein